MRTNPAPDPARRGFTLMELAIALACMGLTAIAATMSFSLYASLMKKTRLETHLRQRAETTLEYVVNEARRAGGQGAPSPASVIVEDDCGAARGFPDCDNSDRVTMVQPLAGYGRCRVRSVLGGDRVEVSTVRTFAAGASQCCLQGNPFRRQVAFVKNGAVTPAVLEGAGGCTFRFVPIVNAPGDLSDASIVMADVKTFYREPGASPGAAGRLVMHIDLDGNRDVTGERLYLSNDILDFQARPGGGRLGISVVAGKVHDAGSDTVSTAFSTSRALARKFIAREATATLTLRDAR